MDETIEEIFYTNCMTEVENNSYSLPRNFDPSDVLTYKGEAILNEQGPQALYEAIHPFLEETVTEDAWSVLDSVAQKVFTQMCNTNKYREAFKSGGYSQGFEVLDSDGDERWHLFEEVMMKNESEPFSDILKEYGFSDDEIEEFYHNL